MDGFKDQRISWKGVDYTIKAQGIMPLVAEVEDVLRGNSGKSAVHVLLGQQGPSVARLSMAYGAILRYAGADVSDDEVYLSIQKDLAEGSPEYLENATRSAALILSIISPPMSARLNEVATEEEDEKKPKGADS